MNFHKGSIGLGHITAHETPIWAAISPLSIEIQYSNGKARSAHRYALAILGTDSLFLQVCEPQDFYSGPYISVLTKSGVF